MEVPSPKGLHTTAPDFSDAERRLVSILIVEPQKGLRQHLRQILRNLGFANMAEAPDHATALTKLEQRGFTHVIFEAKRSNMPAAEFLSKALDLDERLITIPSSSSPSIDDVFGLLTAGARGYIVKPFNEEAVDDSITMATKGEPISECILHAKDRNEALASLMLTSLDKVATVLRQSNEFETARRELPQRLAVFRRSTDIARTFANGGDAELVEAIARFCEERSNGPATRLGRVREKLRDRVERKPTLHEDNDPPEQSYK